MTVVSLKLAEKTDERGLFRKIEGAVFRIALSDGSLFSFKSDYLFCECPVESVYIPGRELDSVEVEALRFAAACYRAERAVLRLTARAEQHSFGVVRKLGSRGYSAPCVRAVVAHLSALGVINDCRYASRWIQSRLSRSSGESPRTLSESLRGRGLSRSAVQEALAAVLDEEAEASLLHSYLEKNRRRPSPRFRAAGEGRLKQSLRYEGFSPDVLERFQEEGLL
ncbi:MAG: recombination regulator RecX [Spirochaetaceae bacterium]|nr:recombination regulator RecX [Spirochaetaceae bacterium]